MKKSYKLIGAVLAAAMLLSFTACIKKEEKRSSRKRTNKETTEETTEEPDETATAETTKATEVTETTETTEVIPEDKIPGEDLNLLIDVPAENCTIAIPDEKRPEYKMNLTLDEEECTIGGHVEYTFTNYSKDDWDKLCFRDYSSIFTDENKKLFNNIDPQGGITEITNITDHRNNIEMDYSRDTDVSVVWVELDDVLKPGDEMTISYDFVAKIPKLQDRYGYSDRNKVYNITNFYPIMAVYDDNGWSHEAFYSLGECFYSVVCDYEVDLTVPCDMTVLSTGVEKGESKKDDQKTISYEAICVRDFVFSASNEFYITEGNYNNTCIRVACSFEPDEENTVGNHALKCAIDSLAAFGTALGEYPYPDLEVVLSPIDAGGMEYPNLVLISYWPASGESEEDLEMMLDTVIAHEIGHQWFMGIVGNNSGLEPWLDESLASYTEDIYDHYVGNDNKEDDYDNWFMYNYLLSDDNIKYMKENGLIPINKPYYDFDHDMAYVMAVYSTGKDFYMLMCDTIGRDQMYAVLREYIQRTAFTNSTEDILFDTIFDCVGTDNKSLNKYLELFFDIDISES